MRVPSAAGVLIALGLGGAANAATLDLMSGTGVSEGETTYVDFAGAKWATAQFSEVPTGSGVFDPFLRIQQDNLEMGYNTDRQQSDMEYNEKSGVHTHSVLFSDLLAVDGYYEFTLDLGEPSGGDKSKISLLDFIIYTSTDADVAGRTFDAASETWSTGEPTKHYDLDAGGNNTVDLDYDLIKSGNGRADLFIKIPTAYFVDPKEYFILFAKFGRECTEVDDPEKSGPQTIELCTDGNYPSDGTFEEFAARTGETPVIPLPAAGWLLVAGIGGLAAMKRKKRAA